MQTRKTSAKKGSVPKLPLRAIIGAIALIVLVAVWWFFKFPLPSLPFPGNRPLATFNQYPIWVIGSKNLAVYREMKIYPDRIEKQITLKKISSGEEARNSVIYEVIPKEVAPRASLINFGVKPRIVTEDPVVMYESDALGGSDVRTSWTAPNPQLVAERISANSATRKKQEEDSAFLGRFTSQWPTFAQKDPLEMWKELNKFSRDQLQENAKMVAVGKTITVSKDIVDIAAILATGTGILDAANLASEVYGIGVVLFGEDTGQLYDYANLGLTAAGVLKSGYDNREVVKAAYDTGILAIKQGKGIKNAATASHLAQAAENVSSNAKGVSAVESAGVNIAGTIIDYAIINSIVSTNKYILFEMAQQAQMNTISTKLVDLWQKYQAGTLTDADAKQIIELEMLFFTVQQDELRVRKEYLRTKLGLLDTAFSLIPLAGQLSARSGIKDINGTMKLGQEQISSRVYFRDKIYHSYGITPVKVEDFVEAEQKSLKLAQALQNQRDRITDVLEPGTADYEAAKKKILSGNISTAVSPRPTPTVQPTTKPTPTTGQSDTSTAPAASSKTFSFSLDSFPATLMGYPKTKTSTSAPADACSNKIGVIGYIYAEYSQGSKTYAASTIDFGTAGKAAEVITSYPACFTSVIGTTVSATAKGSAAGYTFYTLGSGDVVLTSFTIVDRYMVTMTTLVSGNSENNQSDLQAAMTELIGKMFSGTGSTATTAPATTAPSGGCQNVNLADAYTTYYFYKSASPCSGYSRSATSSRFSVRCTQADAQWREYYVKEVSTGGVNTLTVKASLGLTDHASFFSECSGTGVKSDNYVFLSVLGSDPRSSLASQCNRAVSESDWPQCALSDPAGLGSCGVAKCTTSASCTINVNTSGKDKIYIVFRVSDAWMADIEGSVGSLSVCPK